MFSAIFAAVLCALRSKALLADPSPYRLSQSRIAGQLRGFVGCFPREVGIVASEVAVGGSLAVNRTTQLERLDDSLGRQLEVRPHQVRDNFGIDLVRAKRFNQNAHRLSDADRVRELQLAAVSHSGSNNVFRDVTRHVSCGPINLGRIFAAESTAAMTPHASVGIDNNLPAR